MVAMRSQGRCPARALHLQGSRRGVVKKITVLNQKGGVGKTTVSVNLAYGLARAGKRTLLIDLDPQAHSSTIYCTEIAKGATIGAVFEDRNTNIAQLVQPAQVHGEATPNLFII